MCGIVGMSFREGVTLRSAWKNELRECFSEMLVKAQRRGSGATGVVLMSKESGKPKATVFRAPLPATDFIKTDDYKKLISRLDGNSLSIIGHTRAVTTGPAENNRNNHPHIHGPIIGVHNGGITNHEKLWNKYAAYMKPKGECDSEVFFALVNRKITALGMKTEDAMAEAAGESKGWWAFVLVNAKDPGKIYILRDSGTALDLAWWKSGGTALFASEYVFIETSFKSKVHAGRLRRHEIDANTVFGLDSTIRGEPEDFLVHYRDLPKRSSIAQARLLADNKETYETTTGRKVNG